MEKDLRVGIKHWWNSLNDQIDMSIKLGHKVILIAISRKMPRIFDWVESVWIPSIIDADEHRKYTGQIERIKMIGLVCEHAIPFILASDTAENDDIIVIDDVIIRGNSMKDVTEDIYAFTKKKPYISAIYISELCKHAFSNAVFKERDKVELVRKDDIKDVVDTLCNCIKSCALPMEMEFPIFHVASKFDSLREAMDKGNSESRYANYSIEHRSVDIISGKEITLRNFSVILEHELKWSLNHDYPKVRLFEKMEGSSCLEVSAPRVIKVSDTQSAELFVNAPYKKLWNIILESINTPLGKCVDNDEARERVSKRRALTLAVWANYLFSFSVGMNACLKTSILKKFPEQPEVSEKDIVLLLGKENASVITGLLNEIGRERVTEPLIFEKYFDTDMYISEESVREKYEDARYFASLNFDSIDVALTHLFQVHQNPTMMKLKDDWSNEFRLPYLGETISSLETLMRYRYMDEEKSFAVALNKAMDKGIDEGRISPFYSQVESSGGSICWRRFYRGGARSIC